MEPTNLRKMDKLTVGLIIYPLLAFVVSLQLPISMLGVTTLFFLPPAAIVLFKAHDSSGILKASIIGTAVFFAFDYIAHATSLWYVETIFVRINTVSAFESAIWGFLFAVYSLGLYKIYWDNKEYRYNSPLFHLFELLGLGYILLSILPVTFPATLAIPYPYLLLIGPFIIIPFLYGVWKLELPGLVPFTAYFVYTNFLHELAALESGAWYFPTGPDIALGYVTLLGHPIPYEEFIIYILLLAPTVIIYHNLLAKRVE